MNSNIILRCSQLGMKYKDIQYIPTTYDNGRTLNRKMIIGSCIGCNNNLQLRLDCLYREDVNKVYCETCVVNKYTNILKSRGCRFIRKYRNKDKEPLLVEYEGADGNIFSVRTTGIINNEFKIAKRARNNQYYLYRFAFASNGNMYFKVGYSFDPDRRLKNLKLKHNCSISILRIFSNESDARNFERKVHKGFDLCKINKEEADVFTDGLRRSRTKEGVKYTKDGITEWFKIPLEFYCRTGDPVGHYLFEKELK